MSGAKRFVGWVLVVAGCSGGSVLVLSLAYESRWSLAANTFLTAAVISAIGIGLAFDWRSDV
jgi:hypothetical protein